MRTAAGLLIALLLGLPAFLLTRHVAVALSDGPDPAAVGAVVYPGVPVAVTEDPFARDEPAWLRFMMARDGFPSPEVAPREQPSGTAAPLIRETRDRLSAAGWAIEDGTPDSVAFWATRDRVRAAFYAFDSDPDGLATFVTVHRQPAWWANRLAVAGGVLGALAGWLLARWAVRSLKTETPCSRTVIRETTVVGVALVTPALVQSMLPSWDPATLPYTASLLLQYARWPAALGVLLLAATLLVLAIRSRPERYRRARRLSCCRPPGRRICW